jgi:hypothetical protein
MLTQDFLLGSFRRGRRLGFSFNRLQRAFRLFFGPFLFPLRFL